MLRRRGVLETLHCSVITVAIAVNLPFSFPSLNLCGSSFFALEFSFSIALMFQCIFETSLFCGGQPADVVQVEIVNVATVLTYS